MIYSASPLLSVIYRRKEIRVSTYSAYGTFKLFIYPITVYLGHFKVLLLKYFFYLNVISNLPVLNYARCNRQNICIKIVKF